LCRALADWHCELRLIELELGVHTGASRTPEE
jgi:hypothetical protein